MWITTKNTQGIQGVIQFVFSRLTRIYLSYWVFLLAMFYLYHHKLEKFDIMGSIFLSATSSSTLLLKVAWTLQFELYFYTFFALLLFLNRKYVIRILVSFFFLIILIQVYGSIHIDMYAKNVFNGVSTFYTFWTSPFILEFLLGSFIGYYFDTKRIKYLFPFYILFIGLLVIAMVYQKNYIDGSLAEGYYLPARILFLGTSSAVLLVVAIELNKRNIILFPYFSLLVGGASYSMYLGHNMILLILYGVGVRDSIAELGSYQVYLMLIIVIFIVILSVIYYQLIEKRIMRYIKYLKTNYIF